MGEDSRDTLLALKSGAKALTMTQTLVPVQAESSLLQNLLSLEKRQ